MVGNDHVSSWGGGRGSSRDHAPGTCAATPSGAAPIRVQLSRAKGWRKPANTVVVSRPTKWGNPHDWREWRDGAPDVFWGAAERDQWCREQATEAFAADLRDGTIKLPINELRGLNLACWCKGSRFTCHADVLLELANAPIQPETPLDERAPMRAAALPGMTSETGEAA